MADKRVPLVIGEYYHIFNRGVAKQPIFFEKKNYEQMLLALNYYRFQKPPIRLSRFKELSVDQKQSLLENLDKEGVVDVEIISYCLMPNHFHLLLKQVAENGISRFMSKFSNSYTKYLNTKNDRVGPIFQGLFKAVRVEDDEQLIHVSRYIHLNPLIGFVVDEADFLSYPWSSLSDYLKGESRLINMKPVLDYFTSAEDYKKFVLDQVGYARKLNEISHLILD